MRLIDADALKEGIACHKQWTDQEYETDRQWAVGYNAGIDRALFSITYASTIEAEPVRHGRWVQIEGFTACSECGASPADWEAKPDNPLGVPPYCHSCGAKMDKEG